MVNDFVGSSWVCLLSAPYELAAYWYKTENINRKDSTRVYMLSDCSIYYSTWRPSLIIVNTVYILVYSSISEWIK